MKRFYLPLAAALLSISLPALAADRAVTSPSQVTLPNATTDPLIPIYRTSGVRDDGQDLNLGVATVIHCTNLSSVTETLKIILRQWNGSVLSTQTFSIPATHTFTIATHGTALYDEDAIMFGTGSFPVLPVQTIDQGNFTISSTTTNMYCSVMMVDAASTSPVGVSLHMLRFNPMVGAEGE